MAQLKDTVITGSLQVTDSILSSTIQATALRMPTTSSGTSYGVGENGQVLQSNGISTFWGNLSTVSGMDNYLLKSGGNLTGTVTSSSTIISKSSSGIYSTDDHPIFYFLKNTTVDMNNKLGAIFTQAVSTNNVRRAETMWFRLYSYNSSTGAFSGGWEQYSLPAVSANLEESGGRKVYEILTTKNFQVTLNGTATTSASFYAPTSAGTAGQFLKSNGSGAPTWDTVAVTDEKVKVTARGTTKAYLLASTSATSNGTAAVAETEVYLGTTAGHLYATAVHNAVWNDYAEYRKQLYTITPGHVIQDTDSGYILQTEERLIPGAQIVSDTWGHIMGETDEAKTPVAVAGRVLAYTYRPREEYHAGMAVCSAPGGTVDIMTREEIRNYPDAIIGIVSEIPNYEEWGTGKVKVNGRIWIKVK